MTDKSPVIPTTTILRYDHLAALRLFCAKDEIRYYLHGVSVSRHPGEGVDLAATDGHILGMIYDPTSFHNGPDGDTFILKLDELLPAAETVLKLWKKAHKNTLDNTFVVIDRPNPLVPKGKVRMVVEATPEEIMKGYGVSYPLPVDNVIIDGTYPDYRRVFLDYDKPMAAISGNPVSIELMMRMVKAATIFVDDIHPGIQIRPPEEKDSPRTFFVPGTDKYGSGAQIVMIAMPLRNTNATEDIPGWLLGALGRIKQPEAKAEAEPEKPAETVANAA